MQERYWKFMAQKKFDLIYLNEHFSKYVAIDRTVAMILAIISSSSIASWAIWQNLSFVWAFIIASSQVLAIVNDNLPYKKRIKELSEVSSKLLPLYNEVEYSWLGVSNGELNEKSINELMYKYRRMWTDIENQYFRFDSLPQKVNLLNKAEIKKNQYFINNF